MLVSNLTIILNYWKYNNKMTIEINHYTTIIYIKKKKLSLIETTHFYVNLPQTNIIIIG